eukprot:TRINITY_DN11426_c0_g1_i1.p1 TRINITY_DN11426_c0_g1~~TRINITY_DN11426_c0_g1_i1.p1  ORF type:complete len:371 (-),score=22.64 TRINITY_DN11426_c0_g1_i1:69-1145(-)
MFPTYRAETFLPLIEHLVKESSAPQPPRSRRANGAGGEAEGKVSALPTGVLHLILWFCPHRTLLLVARAAWFLYHSVQHVVSEQGGGTGGLRLRAFVETVELHFVTKGYNPRKDRRPGNSIFLPHAFCPGRSVVLLADSHDLAREAEWAAVGVVVLPVEKLPPRHDAKAQRRLWRDTYDIFLASASIIRRLPRLVGSWCVKTGRFPLAVPPNEAPADSVDHCLRQMRPKRRSQLVHFGFGIADLRLSVRQIAENVAVALRFGADLPRGRENIARVLVKTTMGHAYVLLGPAELTDPRRLKHRPLPIRRTCLEGNKKPTARQQWVALAASGKAPCCRPTRKTTHQKDRRPWLKRQRKTA